MSAARRFPGGPDGRTDLQRSVRFHALRVAVNAAVRVGESALAFDLTREFGGLTGRHVSDDHEQMEPRLFVLGDKE